MLCHSQLSTPEGTNTVSVILIVVVRITIIKVHVVSVISIVLCTTPVVSGGVRNLTSIHKSFF